MSWAGKILRVDLTAGTVKSEPLKMDWARQYIGSRGLATKYLVEEMDAKVDPLSPANKIIWATGPLTGTMASTGPRENGQGASNPGGARFGGEAVGGRFLGEFLVEVSVGGKLFVKAQGQTDVIDQDPLRFCVLAGAGEG